jgi:hypothetical protein
MQTLKGTVLDERMNFVPFVYIYINDTIKIGKTDLHGKYEVVIPVGIDSIIFRGVGYEPLLVKLTAGCNRVDPIMIMSSSYDFMSPEKVDRKRRRRFAKVSKLYSVAFQKGLFASDAACFKIIFQPVAPGMRARHKLWLQEKHSAQQGLLR